MESKRSLFDIYVLLDTGRVYDLTEDERTMLRTCNPLDIQDDLTRETLVKYAKAFELMTPTFHTLFDKKILDFCKLIKDEIK